jgi:hypothetical protein
MFDEFLANGSVSGVLLMAYVNTVMIETVNAQRAFHGINTPPILLHPISGVIRLLALPCIVWPSIYVGLHSGWIAAIVVFFTMQILGGIASIPLGIKRNIGFHFIGASLVFPVGYYLSIANLP